MAKTKKIRAREITFEGKNIHFSPLDNKPLCSFSNKLCRQRRLNGFAFCIRHILEDKSSPFKQCDYVTRNNGQRCLNAIPSDQERGYCHSHMQVAGIIPKTERKIKAVQPSTAGAGKISDSKKENKKKASLRTDNNQHSVLTTKSSAIPQKQQLTPTLTSPSPTPASLLEKNVKSLPIEKVPVVLNGKANGGLPNGKLPAQKKGQAQKKQSRPKLKTQASAQQLNQQTNQQSVIDGKDIKLDLQFEHLSQLKITDLKNESPLNDAKLVKAVPSHLDIPMILSLDDAKEFSLGPPFIQKRAENGKHFETRQEFLQRVRSAFKSHCKMFRRAYKLSQSQDECNKLLRESLLSCVLPNTKISASKPVVNSQMEATVKVEKPLNRNGDKVSQSSLNLPSNNSVRGVANNKYPVSVQHNGELTYINPNFLRDFDENLSAVKFKENGISDSSPWMNGGMHDNSLLNAKKARTVNPQNKQLLEPSHFSDPKASSHISIKNERGPVLNGTFGTIDNVKIKDALNHQLINGIALSNDIGANSHALKKRKLDLENGFDELEHNLGLDYNGVSGSPNNLLCSSHYSSVAHFETVLNSVSSSETITPDGVITDASFDSPFDHSTTSHPDCDFSDDVDDLEKTFELQIDPEIAHQASRLLEDNELTEDDFNELFPETRSLNDHKLGGDLGIDFTTTFDADIDYSLFANIFPNFRSSNPSEVISVTQNF